MGALLEIRRYPVKAMAGESLPAVTLDRRGLVGDRWWACVDEEGRMASNKNTRRFRRYDAINDYAARHRDGRVEVTGPHGTWPADDPRLTADLTAALGAAVGLLPEGEVSHHDSGAVSLVGTATLAWCEQQWGGPGDPRRFRVNLLVETAEPFVEETWIGGTVSIGSVILRPTLRIPRCRTIDLAQDGVPTSPSPWLRPLGAERDLCLGIYLDVVEPGSVSVDDAVSFTADEPASSTERMNGAFASR